MCCLIKFCLGVQVAVEEKKNKLPDKCFLIYSHEIISPKLWNTFGLYRNCELIKLLGVYCTEDLPNTYFAWSWENEKSKCLFFFILHAIRSTVDKSPDAYSTQTQVNTSRSILIRWECELRLFRIHLIYYTWKILIR